MLRGWGAILLAGWGALQDSGEQWSHLASGFEADISQQPALLQGGQLRDYQLKVRQHSTQPSALRILQCL